MSAYEWTLMLLFSGVIIGGVAVGVWLERKRNAR